MKTHTIVFPFDSKNVVEDKIEIIKKLVDKDNISYNSDLDNCRAQQITFRCGKKTWKEIKFQLALVKVYL